ncbi:MAG TPA: Rne/Rng family ribonuclease [Candidatus Angelobacter sp.]|nr:Rne/Rng family ribonuclease [Candidatus Angelobacter sp.]
MAKELFVSSTPHETKVAVVEEDQLSEIYFERENEYTLAGSIYKGRVTRVLPGMQSAFVNIGLERDAFLYVSDFLLEEDEDADAIGEAVASSRNAPIIEVRSPDSHHGPIEAQEIMPPLEEPGQEEEDEPGQETAERASGENGGAQEPEREGARKWRGRRRRGRGGRDRFADRGSNDQAAGERSDREKPVETATEESSEPRANEPQAEDRHEPRHEGRDNRHEERHERRPEPRHDRHESRYDNRRDSRHESRSEQGSEQRPEPILLPGESISKYQPHQSMAASAAPQAPVKTDASPRPKPSTEYRLDPSAFSAGSMVLPGESLAKYGKKTQPVRNAVETAEREPVATEPAAAEPQERGFLQDAESTGPVPRQFEEHEEAQARVEAPTVFHRREPAPPAPVASAPPSVTTFEDEEPPASGPDEHRFESMNVASAFGSSAVVEETTEMEETELDEEDQAEAATHLDSALESPAQEQQAWSPASSTQGPAQQARGVMEEEEIEEEESDIPGFEEDPDIGEFEELEEEVLGQAGEQMVPMGSELMEAVRDAKVNERATGQYEAEGLEPEELEQVEEAFGLEEEDSENGEEEGAEEHEELEGASAEQRAPAAAGYQQRTDRRPQDRRGGRRGGPPGRRMRGRPQRHQSSRSLPAISDLLKEGQEILVQIAKEPIAKKGARITSHIALPGRYLVYMPTVHHTGVSRKIGSEEERHRLKRIALSERGDAQGGFIVRTAAAGAEEQDLRNDIRFLINLWTEIRGRAETSKAPALIYHDLNLVERILRDQVSGSFSAIWADTEQEYERILRFVSRFQPSLVRRVKLYSKDTPLFEQFNITDEINKALKSKVWLRSGGYIVINQTEALVAIDINTGKYVGKTARLEDTIVKTNIDAIKEIVRQIRLRDLGGIIVIDFIDMDERRNRAKVMQALEEALKADRAPSKVLQFNDFGLVAITRKRVKQSLERTLGQPCPTCSATGMIKSVTTVCNEIYVELRKMARHFERDVMVRVNPEVGKALKGNNGRWLQEMEELVKQTVLVKSDPLLHPEQFDIQ